MKKIFILLILVLVSCKTTRISEKESDIEKKEQAKEQVQEQTNKQTNTEEKSSKKTEEKSQEKADKKTVIDGTKTIIYENYYKGSEIKTNEEFQKAVMETLAQVLQKQTEFENATSEKISEIEKKENKMKNTVIFGGIAMFIIIALLVLRNFKII